MQYKSEDSWTNCFTLTAPETNIAIPSVAYLGFSGETGELSDNHDIVSVKSQNLYSVGPSSRSSRGPSADSGRVKKTKKRKGSWSGFLFKTVLFFVAVAGCYVGFTMYRNKKRYSRF